MTKKNTELVRMNKKLKEELQVNFPEVPMPALIDVMYKTSAIRPENVLRRIDRELSKPKKR